MTVQSDVRGSSDTPWVGLKPQAWSARTPQFFFKSASPDEKLAHGAQLPPKPETRNDCGSAIRCAELLQRTLSGTKNDSMERTHSHVFFQVSLYA